MDHRALYNQINFLQYIIPPPILGAFNNNEKNILFIDIEQSISQLISKLNYLYNSEKYSMLSNASEMVV